MIEPISHKFPPATDPKYVTVNCVYFKRSGKYYASGGDRFEIELFKDATTPRDYGYRLLDLRKLPGLQNGTWDGPFVVFTGTYPELCIP